MKVIKEVEMTTKILAYIQCDICGKKADKHDWSTGTYDVNETEFKILIRQRNGVNYPEGGWGTEYEADICPNCFKDKLIPWLDSQGCKVKKKQWDW